MPGCPTTRRRRSRRTGTRPTSWRCCGCRRSRIGTCRSTSTAASSTSSPPTRHRRCSTGRRTATGCATPTRSGSGPTTSPESTPPGSSTTPASTGGLAADAEFVIVGDLNSDPLDGDSLAGATDQLLALDRVQDPATDQRRGGSWPRSPNGRSTTPTTATRRSTPLTSPTTHPATCESTTSYRQTTSTIVDAGVFWPPTNDDLARLVTTEPLASSDHRLVWVDLT